MLARAPFDPARPPPRRRNDAAADQRGRGRGRGGNGGRTPRRARGRSRGSVPRDRRKRHSRAAVGVDVQPAVARRRCRDRAAVFRRLMPTPFGISPMTDPLVIAGTALSSRLLVGTAGYPNQQVLLDCLEASGAELVTVSIRRISLEGYAESLVDLLGGRYRLL